MSESLTDFILARITEDEAAALAVRPLESRYDMGGNEKPETFTHGRFRANTTDGWGNEAADDPATPRHFARHSPARVLAECAAKRRIVEEHVLDLGLEGAEPGCRTCSEVSHYDGGRYSTGWPCETLAALASVYADHRAYDPAWSRP